MLCKDVMDVIEAAYPREYALDWDNVGLLVGRYDKEVRGSILPWTRRMKLLTRRSKARPTCW